MENETQRQYRLRIESWGCNRHYALLHYSRLTYSTGQFTALLRKLLSTPRSLKSCCRLVILQNIKVREHRRQKKLGYLFLPWPLTYYLEFSDLCDPAYGYRRTRKVHRIHRDRLMEQQRERRDVFGEYRYRGVSDSQDDIGTVGMHRWIRKPGDPSATDAWVLAEADSDDSESGADDSDDTDTLESERIQRDLMACRD